MSCIVANGQSRKRQLDNHGLNDVDLEVIKETIRQLLSKIELDFSTTNNIANIHKSNNNNKNNDTQNHPSSHFVNKTSLIAKDFEADLATTNDSTNQGDVHERVYDDDDELTANERKQLESSPEDDTCDLVIDSEALQPPPSNESHQDMVTLRNLEISPPPPYSYESSSADGKRKRVSTESTSTTCQPESTDEGGRSKRQRRQTKLFQVSETTRSRSSRSGSRTRKKSTTSSTTSETDQNSNAQDTPAVLHNTTDLQDVIYYEKNDYLAIRNEENTFYLCQLTESVRVFKPYIKIKWLDTKDDGKTYFLTQQYDTVPHKSIIMPVCLKKLKRDKKGGQIYILDDQDEEIIMERLKRSLNMASESSGQHLAN